MTGDVWEVRTLLGSLALELHGDPPGLVLVQGSDRVRVDLAHVKAVHSAALRDGMIAAMGDAAADLAPRPYELPRKARPGELIDRKAHCALDR